MYSKEKFFIFISMNSNRQLFCSFATPLNIDDVIDFISTNFIPLNGLVFIYENVDNEHQLILTYNIVNNQGRVNTTNALAIHRKTETNTFYSINALNTLIKLVNNGILDFKYKLDWDMYENTLLLTSKGNLNKTGLAFKEKVRI